MYSLYSSLLYLCFWNFSIIKTDKVMHCAGNTARRVARNEDLGGKHKTGGGSPSDLLGALFLEAFVCPKTWGISPAPGLLLAMLLHWSLFNLAQFDRYSASNTVGS